MSGIIETACLSQSDYFGNLLCRTPSISSLFSVSVLSDAFWSVSQEQNISASIQWYEVKPRSMQTDISHLLDNHVEKKDDPKLFIVACELDCLLKLLQQVSFLCVL